MENGLPGAEFQYRMAPGLRLRINPSKNARKAGVLMLLYPYRNTVFTVFMKRTRYPGAHSGQISLPGGKMEQQDNDITSTALRESEEEIGIRSDQVHVVGYLTELHIPVSNMLVYPVIGTYPERPDFQIDQSEVEYLIESPLVELLKPGTRKSMLRLILLKRDIVPYYNIQGHHIWGATAMIISEFAELLHRIQHPHQ